LGRKFGDEKEVKEKDLVKAENTKMDSGEWHGASETKQSRCLWLGVVAGKGFLRIGTEKNGKID
jgi:hypothetical protein